MTMKNIKKFTALCLAAVMGMSLFAGCGSSSSAETGAAASSAAAESTASAAGESEAPAEGSTAVSDAKIGLITLVENGAFMDMKSGITDKLAAAACTNVDYQRAGGDTTALQTIVTSMTDGSYDLVITIATPPTQAVVNVESDTPMFSALYPHRWPPA